MSLPAWPLLFWCGTAATCVAATIGALIGGRRPAPWALAPRPRDRSRAFALTLAGGLLTFPLVYGLIFELLQRATLGTGLLIGAGHALAAFAASRPRTALRAAISSAIVALAYGASMGLFYLTP